MLSKGAGGLRVVGRAALGVARPQPARPGSVRLFPQLSRSFPAAFLQLLFTVAPLTSWGGNGLVSSPSSAWPRLCLAGERRHVVNRAKHSRGHLTRGRPRVGGCPVRMLVPKSPQATAGRARLRDRFVNRTWSAPPVILAAAAIAKGHGRWYHRIARIARRERRFGRDHFCETSQTQPNLSCAKLVDSV